MCCRITTLILQKSPSNLEGKHLAKLVPWLGEAEVGCSVLGYAIQDIIFQGFTQGYVHLIASYLYEEFRPGLFRSARCGNSAIQYGSQTVLHRRLGGGTLIAQRETPA